MNIAAEDCTASEPRWRAIFGTIFLFLIFNPDLRASAVSAGLRWIPPHPIPGKGRVAPPPFNHHDHDHDKNY